jgi:hypothetical protein
MKINRNTGNSEYEVISGHLQCDHHVRFTPESRHSSRRQLAAMKSFAARLLSRSIDKRAESLSHILRGRHVKQLGLRFNYLNPG